MDDVTKRAEDYVNAIFNGARFDLSAKAESSVGGCVLDIRGADTSLLLNEGAELLEAIQHLANQALGRDLEKGERIICDVENFRATREAELRAMARHAAERVRKTGMTFTFGPMLANERRVIHLVLSTEEDLITESVGDGPGRRLRVNPKTSPAH